MYAVREVARDEREDPVPVVGAFPLEWRPTEFPGQVLYDSSSIAQIFACAVPRSQFRHYERIAEREALELYPGLAKVLGI